MTPDLLKIPLAIQITLAAGYLAYVIAYAGLRQHHSPADAAFRSLVFSLPASAIIVGKPFVPYANEAAAVGAALALGVAWRWFGMRLTEAVLRRSGISWSDDIPTAWLSITARDTRFRPSQVVVDIEGGRSLMCDDTRLFEGAPFHPCVFGLDGGVALYVTSERGPDGKWFDHQDVRHPLEGDKITYIPAAAVKRIEIRHWTKANERAWQAAAAAARASEAPEVAPEA